MGEALQRLHLLAAIIITHDNDAVLLENLRSSAGRREHPCPCRSLQAPFGFTCKVEMQLCVDVECLIGRVHWMKRLCSHAQTNVSRRMTALPNVARPGYLQHPPFSRDHVDMT